MESSSGRPATIREVAQYAGVGLGTVSRVLNNHPSVSPATRRRVEDAIEKLGYQPNLQARRLVKGKTETIGFVLGNRDFLDPFHAKMLTGVQRYFASTGHQVVYTSLQYSKDSSADGMVLPKIIRLRGVLDGVIVAGTNYPNLLEALDKVGLPYVVFGNNMVNGNGRKGHDTVSFDDVGGARKLAEKLIQLGHRHVWYIGRTGLPWFSRRYDGYAQAMEAHGLKPMLCTDVEGKDSTHFGAAAMTKLLDGGEPVTAVCCGNDVIAFGASKAARDRGLNVPDDVSIAGFDDRDVCFLTEPELTTVRPFLEEVGAECAKMLLAKVDDSSARFPEVITQTEVVVRGSIGECKAAACGV